jgi:hypothetical protein
VLISMQYIIHIYTINSKKNTKIYIYIHHFIQKVYIPILYVSIVVKKKMHEVTIFENMKNIYNIQVDIKYLDNKYYLTVNGHYAYSSKNFNEVIKVIKAIYITISNLQQ